MHAPKATAWFLDLPRPRLYADPILHVSSFFHNACTHGCVFATVAHTSDEKQADALQKSNARKTADKHAYSILSRKQVDHLVN